MEPTAPFCPPLLTAIPQYPSLPMEKNYWRVKQTATPGLFLRQMGKGRVVYFPWDIDRVYWDVMADDHGRLLRNAIDWALDEERPVTVEGPGVLDVTVWKQKDSMTVHLVNLTNPMMMRPSFRETIPLPAQRVTLQLPPGEAGDRGAFPGRRGQPGGDADGRPDRRDGAVGAGPRSDCGGFGMKGRSGPVPQR